MRQFKYCLWLKLDNNHPLNKECDFPLHITIKSHLEKNDAIKLYKKINKSILPLEIEIKEIKDDYIDNFYAYYFLVDTFQKENLWWWNDSMHLSILYKYGNKNDNYNKIKISNKKYEQLIGSKIIFNEICVFHCDEHYKKWYQVNF